MGGEFNFKYEISLGDSRKNYEIEVPIIIPLDDPVQELMYRLIKTFKLPQFIENELYDALESFISNSTERFYNGEISTQGDSTDIGKEWETVFRERSAVYCDHVGESDEEVFGIAYHKLVHSSALEAILSTEQSYAQAISECVQTQNKELENLSTRQVAEMAEAVEGLDKTTSNQIINELAIKHYEDHSYLQAQCSSELNAIKEVQRRNFRNWVMEMLEDHAVSPLSSPKFLTAPDLVGHEETAIEESFTIHLGSQMKQMYNIRLISGNLSEFFYSQNSPERLQTAMSLYSNDLSGIVLLTDNHFRFRSDFTKICQQSTEFHFDHVENQMESIGECARNTPTYQLRNKNSNVEWETALQWGLRVGDVFITNHSNLAKVHVVFHLLVDNSLRMNDINSRHKVILGLRNILKMACSNNVTTLTIPLLLQHEMTEEMTVQWCTKRAELIFKCVKGFMIEMASWGGSELKNLQFLIPKGISSSVFTSLATMLPGIFKLSNPVIFKAMKT